MISTWAFALLSCLFAGYPGSLLSQGKYSLAVLNLKADHNFVSNADSRMITSELAQEMSQASLFYTMSQAEMERRLLAADQDPAVGCPTLDCAFEAGETLGVQLVIYGTIRPAGTKITIETHLVHIGGREVVKSFSDDISGDLKNVSAQMRIFARKFLGLPVHGKQAEQKTEVGDTPSAVLHLTPPIKMPPQEKRETKVPQKAPPAKSKKNAGLQSKPVPPAPTPKAATPEESDLGESEELKVDARGGGFKWALVGIGALVAGSVSAALLLAPGSDNGANIGGGDTGLPIDPVDDDLPPPPNFP